MQRVRRIPKCRYSRINEDGKLTLVNHLGIDLGETPEQILSKLDDDRIKDDDVRHDGRHAHDYDYVHRVRDIEADTPARYNANAIGYLNFWLRREAGGLCCKSRYLRSGKKSAGVLFGTDQPEVLTEIRGHPWLTSKICRLPGNICTGYLRYCGGIGQRHLPDD
ncbi:hypothetical protein ACNKHU_13115 [Shigella flexneri]